MKTHIKAVGGKSAYITELKPYEITDRLGNAGVWINADNGVSIFVSMSQKKSKHLPNTGKFVFCDKDGKR